MPLILLSLICQVGCGLHVIKSGQERYWLYLIIFFPFLGCVIYFLAIILPELLGSYRGRVVISGLQDKVAPSRNLKKLRDDLLMSNTPKNHEALADELYRIRQYDEAVIHYKEALSGIYGDKPQLLLKLAFAQFYCKQYVECQKTLDYLIEKNPDFQSPDGHLLYARALQMAGNVAKAEDEYKVLVGYYSGPQARFYYATLLESEHRAGLAIQQLEEIVSYAKLMPKHYQRMHAECLSDTKKMLKTLSQHQ